MSPSLRLASRTARGLVAAVGAATVVLAATSIPAQAATPPANTGLYGSQDPTYDGVYRQSLSLLALNAAGATPDASAVQWLKDQQCADGSFTNYRADTSVACATKEKDSNATGLAIQALAALGQPTATAVQALRGFQLPDGGFYVNQIYGPPASDANSTGIALSAFTAVGIDPATVQSAGKNGQDFLLTLQLACDETVATQRGAYDYMPQTPLVANDFATVQAALGMAGKALPVAATAGTNDAPDYVCPSAGTLTAADSADAAAGYLARRIAGGSGLIPSSYGTGADYTSTANAVLALVATGKGADQVTSAMAALASNVAADKIRDASGKDVPGALAVLTLAAEATGANPASFGGTDLVTRLAATLTKAAPVAATPSTPAPKPELPFTGAPVALLALVGGGLLVAGAAMVVRPARGGSRG